MKKIALTLMASVLLTACATGTGTSTTGSTVSNLGAAGVQMYVQNKCVTELQSRNEWRLAALAMSQAQQNEWEQKICGCASEEAPQQLTAADMTQLLTQAGRTKVATEVTARTVTACFKRLYQK
ncbi:hypothetical protein [Wielerella bovis]|uniref:hypothetical protein n=1 Tax=Wielerella bovis TaxID=2917790 RepID=UPI0020189218|nr:hypothetical protein [Wielerella bovis]MCG7657704.1 hypothetical protein [Wielerella bovis]MCG7659925.1 hypothetical protein [Wielerella bovis]ULJ61149.1 hypothetical protein MIS44_04665 [Wielerella bovis]ULJ62113.1 hypothetical protein MIS46_09035 [Wielerella bovis]ULJ64343.1 hypothetical protein MIS33_09355 [Wielerella bovis]